MSISVTVLRTKDQFVILGPSRWRANALKPRLPHIPNTFLLLVSLSIFLSSGSLAANMSATTPLALTTTFSPPAACTTETWWVEYLTGSYYFTTSVTGPLSGWFFSQGPTDWSSCFPSGYQATTDFYYSPGVCPSGYSIASATTISLGTNTETRAACCPS